MAFTGHWGCSWRHTPYPLLLPHDVTRPRNRTFPSQDPWQPPAPARALCAASVQTVLSPLLGVLHLLEPSFSLLQGPFRKPFMIVHTCVLNQYLSASVSQHMHTQACLSLPFVIIHNTPRYASCLLFIYTRRCELATELRSGLREPWRFRGPRGSEQKT